MPPAALTGPLQARVLLALDGLLRGLELEPLGADRFRLLSEPAQFDRIFGGQLVAQALLAAGATVADKVPHSLHAYFANSGTAGEPLDLAVERVRDGRSIATRRVTVLQNERPLLAVIASFHADAEGPELADPAPVIAPPESVPLLQDWVPGLSPEFTRYGRSWVKTPPPLELRIGEPPNFMGGPCAQGARSHWMRLPRDVGADPLLQTVLLAYASDYFLLDMMFRAHPDRSRFTSFAAFSLDHSLWFHRPVRFDRWHSHTQQMQAISGDRGLVRGEIRDEDGHLVASVMQEALIRSAPSK